MKTLITGATGHVGANLVAHLNRAGVRPLVLLRETSRTAAIDDLEWEAVRGDVTDPGSLSEAMRGVSLVYHVAASVSFAKKGREMLEKINVEGTRNVVRACLERGVSRLVHTSSVAAVGSTPDPARPIDERAEWNFGEWDLVYASSKRRSEQLVLDAVREHRLSAVVVNPSLVFGERDVNVNAGRMLVQLKRRWMIAASPGTQAVCDADDVACAHIRAAERGREGERYLVVSECMSYRELFTRVARCVGGRPPLFTLPAPVMRAVGRLSEDLIFAYSERDPPLTWEMAARSTLHSNFDASKLTRELGVTYTPFEQTLEKTHRWLLSHGLI